MKLSQNGLDLIKEFEGLRLKAYPDLGGVPTIGYGTTGPNIKLGMEISKPEAEELLRADVAAFERGVSNLVEVVINQNEFDALVSFSYNVGLSALQSSTLLRLLNDWADRTVVASEFLRWNKVGDKPIEGLTRRRKAERDLFLAKVKNPMLAASIVAKQDTWLKRKPIQSSELAAEEKLFVPNSSAWERTEIRQYPGEQHQRVFLQARPDAEWWFWPEHFKIINDTRTQETPPKLDGEIKLVVPYFSQRDNAKDPMRTCFSSSCAMLLAALDPDAINNDDEFINEVFKYGDTTEASAQLQALKHFGVDAKFVQNWNWTKVESQLRSGIPVPIGVLHKGPVTNPTGGGHWLVVVGVTADGTKFWVHDPFGEMDLINGGYPSTNGKYRLYSKKNLGLRWMVEGEGSGWAIVAK